MYEGKRESKSRHGKTSILLVSLAMLLVFAVGGTLAFLVDMDGPIANKFSTPANNITITEDFDYNVKENVKFTNNSDFSVYLRATYVANWVDADGNVYPGTPKLTSSIGTDWGTQQADGYWYYNAVVAEGGTTSPFIVTMEANETAPNGYHLEVNVIVESVQSEPSNAISEAWGVSAPSSGNN